MFVLLGVLILAMPLFAGTPAAESGAEAMKLHAQERFSYRSAALQEAMTKLTTAKGEMAMFQQSSETPKAKSRGRAFLMSLLVPGWGQHYAGSTTAMRVFVASEVLLLGSFLGFTVHSNWVENDYRTFAVEHAGVILSGKGSGYFVDIGNFSNIFDYNQAQLIDRDVADLYPETDEFFWQWDSDANRREFEDMRVSSGKSEDNAKFALAAVGLNHLISAVHATLAVFRFNKKLEQQELGLRFDSGYLSNRPTLNLTLTKRF